MQPMDKPLVSIVTPAYNQAEYLAATIESVLAQDYPGIEYIVVDDGSPDDTLAMARRYEGERVRVLAQANAGQAATLNRAWGLARGEILAYLSSDDRLCPGAVSTMVKALEGRPEMAVAYCDFWIIDPVGRRLRISRTPEYDARALREELICQPGPGAFFRRRVFESTGGWDVRRRQVPDFEFWLRAAREGDFLRVPEVLAEYRIHKGSASFMAMSPERADEIVEVIRCYWDRNPDQTTSRRSLARAQSIAAKNHAQSGRPLSALSRFAQALRLRPALVADGGIWRRLFVGFARRAYYGLRSATRART